MKGWEWVVVYRYGRGEFKSKEKAMEYIKRIKRSFPKEKIKMYSPRAKRWYAY